MEGDRDGYLCQECRKYDFYPRPHMEGDALSVSVYERAVYFYPRPHMEGDIHSG